MKKILFFIFLLTLPWVPPSNGPAAVGAAEPPSQVDTVKGSPKPSLTAILSLLLEGDQQNRFVMTAPRNLSNSPDIFSQASVIHIDELENVYVIWQERGSEVRMVKSQDQCSSFSSPKIIYPFDGSTTLFFNLTNNGDIFHTSWSYYPAAGGAEIVYSRSTDRGQTFEAPRIISLYDGVNSYGCVHASDGLDYIGAVWRNMDLREYGTYNNISYTFSEDNGETFSYPTVIADFGLSPTIAVYGQYVYIVYIEAYNEKNGIYLSRSADRGHTFSDPVKIYSEGRPFSTNLRINESGDIYIIWCDKTGLHSGNIMITKSVDNGTTFDTYLGASEVGTTSPNVFFDNEDNIYLGWTEDEGTKDDPSRGYFMYSTDQGATFTGPVALPLVYGEFGTSIGSPKIATLKNDKLLFVWWQRGSTDEVPDIFWSTGNDPVQ